MRNWLRAYANALILNFVVCITFFVFAIPTLANAAPLPRVKPPAPGPQYLSRLDLGKLRIIDSDIKKRNFSRAKAAVPGLNDPIARSLAEWMYFYAEVPNVSVTEADRFLDLHPDWPSTRRIQAHVERQMPNSTPPDQILAFFDSRDPVTGDGKLHLTRAMLARGDREVAELHLRDAWANDSFSIKEERTILANYAGRLRSEDHVARVDRLLWARQVTAARRLFSQLPSNERRKAETRAALLVGASSGPQLYNSLSDEDRSDSGVMLAAVRYFRRKGEEPRAASIAKSSNVDPTTIRNAGRWWDERQLLMRWALTNRIYSEAYAMAAGHGLKPGTTDFSEAEFNAGWIALRYLGEADRARTHFAALTAAVGTPISLARGRYWMGRASEALGEDNQATLDFQQAATYPYTYYGQMAAEKLGGDALAQAFKNSPPPSEDDRALFNARPAVAALQMLTDLEDARKFLIFSYHIDDLLQNSGEYLALAELASKMDATHVAVRAGKVSVRRKAFAPEVSYPLIFVPDEARKFVPEEVILGISRQESEFNPRAYSRAGARGLMQLIPSTAKITARKERLPYRRSALLNDPIYNMTLGSAHLSHLIDRFDGSWLMTFAAYNAGAGRVNQWIARYGDPRSPSVDPIDWIENIPFSETRNYVQRVMENAQVYRARASGDPIPGHLIRDIERGGPQNRAGTVDGITSIGNLIPLQPRIAAIADPVLNPPTPIIVPSISPDPSDIDTVTSLPTQPQNTASQTIIHEARDTSPISNSIDTALDQKVSPALIIDEINFQPKTSDQTTANKSSTNALDPSALERATAPISISETNDTSPFEIKNTNKVINNHINTGTSDCVTYTDFLAKTKGEDASAADLNAGALAELQTGGGC